MKLKQLEILSTVIALSLCFTGQAKDAVKTKSARTPDAATRQTLGSEASEMRWGAGFATFGSGSLGTFSSPSLSAQVELNQKATLQMFAALTGTSPFTFGLGAIYRMNLYGDSALGFHAGGGFNLGVKSNLTAAVAGGSATSFYLDLFPVAGFHFGLGGAASNVQLSFDGGPVLAVTPSPVQLTIAPLSVLSGISIHYFF